MATSLRRLQSEDQSEVEALCATVWGGTDYVPSRFAFWATSQDNSVFGLFDEQELLAIANLEEVKGTKIAWIEGLRVKDGHRHEGMGTQITNHLVNLARTKGLRTLWYATGSMNNESMGVARKTGFHLATQVGYYRIEKPCPIYPRPSPAVVPLQVDAVRLCELMQSSADVVDVDRMPITWSFDFKDLDGLIRIGSQTQFKMVISDDGTMVGLYYSKYVQDEGRKRGTYHLFSNDRAVFVDMMSRCVDELEKSDASNGAFFVGPREKEWSRSLGYISNEFDDRTFLLFEQSL